MSQSANLLKNISVFVLSVWIISVANSSYAKNICGACKFENEDADRYCLNCSGELRPMTEEEQKKQESYNRKNEERISNRPLSNQSMADQGNTKDLNHGTGTAKNQFSNKRPEKLYIPGEKVIPLGASKTKVNNLIGGFRNYAAVKDQKTWSMKLASGTGSVTFEFDDEDNLSGWTLEKISKTTETHKVFKHNDIKPNMSEGEVIKRWGNPWKSTEENHASQYSLIYEYKAMDSKNNFRDYSVTFNADKKVTHIDGF